MKQHAGAVKRVAAVWGWIALSGRMFSCVNLTEFESSSNREHRLTRPERFPIYDGGFSLGLFPFPSPA
jgi:hypothetical protein